MMDSQQRMRFATIKIIFNLMVVINVMKVVNQNVQLVQIHNVMCVKMDGFSQITNVFKSVEIIELLGYLLNNVMMATMNLMMGVMIADLNVIRIAFHVLLRTFVFHVQIIFNRQMVNVYLFVVMDMWYPVQRNVTIKMKPSLTGVINVSFNVMKNVINVIREIVLNVREGMKQMIIKNVQLTRKDKWKMKKDYNILINNLYVEIQQGNKMKGVMMETSKIMMGVRKCAKLKIIGNVMKIYQINAIVLHKFYQHISTKHKINNIQKVKWTGASSNFTQAILTKIEGVENKIFITSVIEIDKEIPNDPVYQFEIQILSSKSTSPILVASIQDGVIDEHDFNLGLVSQELQLTILSNSQINAAKKFQTLGNYLMIGLGCKSALMLLLGDPQSSLEIFDTLQFQSYLRFINIQFPQNIQIYFESSDSVTVTPVLIKLNIFDFFNNLIGNEHLDSIGKLQEYKLNADLLTNIYGFMTQIILFFGLFILLIVYKKLFFNYCFSIKHIYYVRLAKSSFVESIAIKFYKLNKKFLHLRNLYTKQGLLQLFYANSWDLLFKVIKAQPFSIASLQQFYLYFDQLHLQYKGIKFQK
ncbi:unnamed protein product [Paramecium sonneborni]|uniref:Transmembrane protein n=1 Tax=Paramecium sonneborni TaxID=65129 RepID=A0A8S1RMR2_9CILI|nr:unnamed protein product [Paramecium sonneborni]